MMKLIIINHPGFPNTLDNNTGGMSSGTDNVGSGSILDYDGSGDQNNDGCICSTERLCLCTNFKDAFNLVENNTVIAINDTTGGFTVHINHTTNIKISNITNISIIGYHKVVKVYCLAKGSIEFKYCSNVIIENITWIQCGNNYDYRAVESSNVLDPAQYVHNFHDDFSNIYFYGLHLAFCRNITLKSCKFEASMVGINDPSGVVYVDKVHFLSTSAHDLQGTIHLATGLIINQTNVKTKNSVVVKIINSYFSQTKCLGPCKNLLLFYILVDDPRSTIKVVVSETNFSSMLYDPGWAGENGIVWIRILSSKNANLMFNRVKFLYNEIQPSYPIQFLSFNFTAIFYIFSNAHGTRVKLKSSTFLNNYASTVALFKGHMSLEVINTQFCNNKADSVVFVEFSSYSYTIFTTVKIVKSTFSNNAGGQLMLLTGRHIFVNILGLTAINNHFLSGKDGFIVFKAYLVLIANITNVKYESNYINAEGSGFHFTAAILADIDIKNFFFLHIDTFYVCIPRRFQFAFPQEYISIYGSVNCFHTTYQWLSFANSSFRNNIGGGHGSIINVNFTNNVNGTSNIEISTSTISNNKGYKSLIHTSNRDFVNVKLIVKDSAFTQNDETLFHIANQVIQFSNENKMTVLTGIELKMVQYFILT